MFSLFQRKALQAKLRRRRPSFFRPALEVLEDRITPTLTLTQAGLDLGLSLTTFASGFPAGNVGNGNVAGPEGIAIPTTGPYAGSVFVTNNIYGQISLFPTDQDNQTAPTVAPSSVPSSNQGLTQPIIFEQGLTYPLGLASVDGNVYYTSNGLGNVYRLNSTGDQLLESGLSYPEGMAVNPTNGHLLITSLSASRIYDYDPATGNLLTAVSDPNGYAFDGVTVSPDGKTVYAATNLGGQNDLRGYDLSTGQLVFNVYIPGGPDGVAYVPKNSPITGLAGDLIVNTNGGTVVAVDPTTGAQTVIASGGSRGDFVAVDPTNGTLLVTQTDSIMRISPDIFEKVTVGPITAPLAPVAINTTINTSASFTDTLASATHSAVWNWGDDTTSGGTVIESNGSGTVSGSHAYTAAGVYTVTLTVMNQLDNSISGQSVFDYVVVYDTSAGFVTGGGWLDSPAGAVATNPTLTGKANFGFNAKYQSGSTVPTGQTEFQFPAANLDFHSTAYDWLVLNGNQAQLQGSGTINGSGNYGFLVTAADNDATNGGGPDAIRIQIWDKNNPDPNTNVVYDTQLGAATTATPTTPLGGGDIQVHASATPTAVVVTSGRTAPSATSQSAPLPSSSESPGTPALNPAPTLQTPLLLELFDSLLGGTETVNADGTETITDSFFGIPLMVSTFDSSGNLESVLLLGIDVTALFEML